MKIQTTQDVQLLEKEENSSLLKIEIENLEAIDLVFTQLFQFLLTKLRVNGEISVKGLDIFQLGYAISGDNVSLEEASKLLYSTGKRKCSALTDTITILSNLGLTILTKRFTANHGYYIVAQRKLSA